MVSRTKIRAYPAIASMLALSVAACGTTPAAPDRDTSDPVSEVVGVQELRREVAELRDSIEMQRNELTKLRERQRQLYDDLDHRLRQAEQGTRQGQGSISDGQQLGYGQVQQDDDQVQDQQQEQQQQQERSYGQQDPSPEQDEGQQASRQGQSGGQVQQPEPRRGTQQDSRMQMAVAGTEEQAAYDNAFELLKQSRYNDAIVDFRSLIAEFPNGALVDDAQYWIGEAYYVTRDFENALEAFETVVDQYPNSQRVPEALLKLGYVQAELGQTDQARRTLNQVITQYPGSRVAISAETRLSKLQ